MTRKDYVLIAKALKAVLPPPDYNNAAEKSGYVKCHRIASQLIAAQLESDNPRFSRSHFLAACGLEGSNV